MKALVWSGAVVTAIGTVILAMFVLPHEIAALERSWP